MREENIFAVIPAAGRGSRLGLDVPKLLAPLGFGRTVWTHLRDSLAGSAGHVHVVMSPAFSELMKEAAAESPRGSVSVGVQLQPLGMGDAIFGAFDHWKHFRQLLVIWGDQAGLSAETLRRVIARHASGAGPRCTLPVVEAERPYVQYVFQGQSLVEIRQAREGALVDARGSSDVGVFLLETEGLAEAWQSYAATAAAGAVTGELNFLPFLVFLSRRCGWTFETVPVTDPTEARGINTREDLKFFQDRFAAQFTAASL